jgi:hypothetical protein
MTEKQIILTDTTKRPRVYKKHFILFNNGGVLSATTPKDWARANQKLFIGYDFSNSDNTPIVEAIEKYLVNQLGYSRIENDEVIIHYPYKNL